MTNSAGPQTRGVEFRSPSCQNYSSPLRIRLSLGFQEAHCEHYILFTNSTVCFVTFTQNPSTKLPHKSSSYSCKNDKPLQEITSELAKKCSTEFQQLEVPMEKQYEMRRATSEPSTVHLPKSHSHIASQLNQPSIPQ